MTMSNKATISRIKWEKARDELSRAAAAYDAARSTHEAAWVAYRDAATAEGWCPFCEPAVPLRQCPGHAFFADDRQPAQR